jgi:hypothetical protein
MGHVPFMCIPGLLLSYVPNDFEKVPVSLFLFVLLLFLNSTFAVFLL